MTLVQQVGVGGLIVWIPILLWQIWTGSMRRWLD